MLKIDEGHKVLTEIVERAEKLQLTDANEAETRLKVIDDVVRTVLGWRIDAISVEDRVSEDGVTTFSDYILKTATTSILIEAKKIGAAFSLPSQRGSLKLGGVLREGEVGEAIRQARDYCRKKAIPFAVVTNGSVWIVFTAVRTDGIGFEETPAKIFRSLEDLKSRLVEFWELLSEERVTEGSLENEMLGSGDKPQITRCLRLLNKEPGFRLGRNALYDYIEPAISAALTDEAILNDPEALEQCYVKTTERLKFDSRLKIFIHDSKPPLGHTSTRLTEKTAANALQRQVTSANPQVASRFIVLLGAVGAGKSTFLSYTRQISARDEISGKIFWAYLDFKRATSADPVRTFVYREIRDLIENDSTFELGDWAKSIAPAYKTEIDRLKKGALRPIFDSDKGEFDRNVSTLINKEREELEPYVNRLLQNSAQFRPTFLVFDNVDQIEDESYQTKIFIEAQAIARKTKSNVILCIRETTFLKHRASPVFDAFQFDSFYLESPTIPPVLSRRLSYAKHVISGKPAELYSESGARLLISDLGDFFEIVSKSLLSDVSGHMLDVLAGGDVRRGLQLVREFLASGHINADKAVSAYLIDKGYKFPAHEVFRGAVLGARKYYDDAHSLVPNILDAKLGSKNLQHLRFRICAYLTSLASESGYEGTPAEEIEQELHKAGISAADVQSVLGRLFATRLIRTHDGLPIQSQSKILPTRLAAYLIRTALTEFAYSELCSQDTIIFDDSTWDKMQQITAEIDQPQDTIQRIRSRISRLSYFIDYQIMLEESWIIEAKRRKLDARWFEPVFKTSIASQLTASFADVIASAEKNYGQTRSTRKPKLPKPLC